MRYRNNVGLNLVLVRTSVLVCCFAFFFSLPQLSFGQQSEKLPSKPPKTAFDRNWNFFPRSFDSKRVLDVIDVSDKKASKAASLKARDKQAADDKQPKNTDAADSIKQRAKKVLEYVDEDPKNLNILPPDKTPSVRVNRDAPSSIQAMIVAMREGDKKLAKMYGAQYIRYLQAYFFELNEIVDVLGDVLIEQNIVRDDQWIGARQTYSRELAKSRYEIGTFIKPTHDAAMRHIKPDSKQMVEIYYFFTLTCSWCRAMTPDVERLWRMVKNDPRIKMTAVTIGVPPADWAEDYRSYNGLTLPLYDGTEMAKKLNIGYVPALVVVAPTNSKAYMKTGQQSFERMYEFVRTVQGLPAKITKKFQQLVATPIGQVEILNSKSRLAKINNKTGDSDRLIRESTQKTSKKKHFKVQIEEF